MTSITLKRIQTEYTMLIKDPPENFVAYPLNDDLFNWHFTIRGPENTEFDSGIFHGIIKLPTNYPMKPPSIMFLTPNGRFDINMDVCLSVTKFHKEDWQPAWTSYFFLIKTILEAIIAFFPVREDHSAIGAIDYPLEVRKKLAAVSQKYICEKCGPIADQVKKKEKKIEASNEEVNNKQIIENHEKINLDNKQEVPDSKSQKSKENDSNSDHSSKKNDNDYIRKKVKKFDKKSDIDRRSFNMEAAIITENIDEEDEYEEEQKKNDKIEESINNLLQESIEKSRRDEISNKNKIIVNKEKYPPFDQKEASNKNETINEKVILDSKETENYQFNDYLRNLRIKQFENSNKDKVENVNLQNNKEQRDEKKKFFEEPLNNQLEEEEKIFADKNDFSSSDKQHGKIEHDLLNQKGVKKDIFFTYRQDPDFNNLINNYEVVKKVISEDIKNEKREELEFYEASKSLKFHRSNSTEEVIKELKSTSIDNNPLNILEKLSRSNSMNLNNNTENLMNDESNKNILIQFLSQLQFLKDQKQTFEELFAKKNLEIKLITKKSLETSANIRLIITNILMAICVIAVFILYYYFRNKF